MSIPQKVRRWMLVCPSVLLLLLSVLNLNACSSKADAVAAPVPQVTAVKVVAAPFVLTEEYAAQTEAADTVEIRARVGGILERQAFADGARVKKGDVLFVIDQQPYITALTLAKASEAQARASAVNSRQNLARARPLLADHAISQQDMDAAIAKEGADAANVQVAAAQVRQAQLNLGYTTITAPRDGIISKALIKPGGLVNASTTLLTTLYSSDPINVTFAIGEQRLMRLQGQLQGKAGDVPPFKVKLVDGSDYPFPGKLNFVDAAVDARSGTLQLRLTVPNPERRLRPGQFVRIVLADPEKLNAILVPQKAVQEVQGKRSVFVVGADNLAAYREIVATRRAGNDWVVERGLASGELVIVDGLQKVKPGVTVKADVVATGESSAPAPAGKGAG